MKKIFLSLFLFLPWFVSFSQDKNKTVLPVFSTEPQTLKPYSSADQKEKLVFSEKPERVFSKKNSEQKTDTSSKTEKIVFTSEPERIPSRKTSK